MFVLDCSLIFRLRNVARLCQELLPESLASSMASRVAGRCKIQAVISLVQALPAGKVGDIRLDHRVLWYGERVLKRVRIEKTGLVQYIFFVFFIILFLLLYHFMCFICFWSK